MIKILFIDDDVLALQLMGKAASLLGYAPLLCDSGLESLKMIADNQPDIIFIDHSLDDIDGTQIIREIRQKEEYAQIRLVMLSAGCANWDAESAMLVGADRYIQKPLSLDGLSEAVDDLIQVPS